MLTEIRPRGKNDGAVISIGYAALRSNRTRRVLIRIPIAEFFARDWWKLLAECTEFVFHVVRFDLLIQILFMNK